MAHSDIGPSWLKSARVAGLDQLGIQVISIALYGDLLPGLTNVTDRIRYYSFYPWLLHRYASEVRDFEETTWQEHLRRAEFLLALVGRLHHRDEREGGEALVGADLAKKVLVEIETKPRKNWQLSKWTAVAHAGEKGSYFKNKNGGFGQYYRGQIASLGLINFSDDAIGVKLAKGHGTEIARICDSQKGRAGFWNAVVKDKFTLEELVTWGDLFCPCALAQHKDECAFLLKILFGPDAHGSDTTSRARTLRLLLAVLKQANTLDDPVQHFRSLAYYEHEATAKRFRPPTDLRDVFEKWTIYETCEFTHYTLEVAFDAILRHLREVDLADADVNRFISSTVVAALSVTSSDLGLGTRKANWCDRTLGDIVEESRTRQRALADWCDDPWSEENLIFYMKDVPPLRRLVRAFACLVALFARDRIPEHPFEAFCTVTPDWLARHRVTLATVSRYFSERMQQNAGSVFSGFLNNCVVGQHLYVAMRKLRHESQSTFKLAIEDGRFIWLEDFEPTRTNPRLRQAFRFLRDIGFCSGQNGGWKLSAEGKDQLGRADGD